jgi:hypothetical protein
MSVRVAQLLVLIGARAQAAAGGTLRGRILLKPMGARKSQFEFWLFHYARIEVDRDVDAARKVLNLS